MSLENSAKITAKDTKSQVQEQVKHPTSDPRMPVRNDSDDNITDRIRKSIDAWHWSNN
ncbi:hypothetical protein [Pseudanabaena sp. ABRG5-3]|uniref:hypothetical protein n=1 Tax=Pseudanabaena sp. ABRG5-3 TaxID=685565 RepID=UPI000DC7356F|nr:hypothetical protein [Pseudanabaena sp. ABRG5-3]BBC26934.1 hypothetical protein ABRG53_c095 [Pseudanabaena sp. ABRG5-3]